MAAILDKEIIESDWKSSFSILNFEVAWVAICRQVRKSICRHPVTIKVSKSFDVMNVESLAECCFSYSTPKTSMTIPSSGSAGLALPVRAVIGRMSSAPRMAILTTPIKRLPFAKTLSVTKMIILVAILAKFPFRYAQNCIAKGTGHLNSWRWLVLPSLRCSLFPAALPRTEVFTHQTVRLKADRNAAPRAINLNLFFLARWISSSKIDAATLHRAKPTVLRWLVHQIGFQWKDNFTVRAFYRDSFFAFHLPNSTTPEAT